MSKSPLQNVLPLTPLSPVPPAGEISFAQCDVALSKLLQSTLRYESLIAQRDTAIAKVQAEYSGRLAKEGAEIARLEREVESFYMENRAALEAGGRKSVQRSSGMIGMRAASNPALVPLDEKWSWDRIAKKVRRVWKARFFRAPKAPAIDKNKIKAELDAAELESLGLKLEASETFYIELSRIPERMAA